MDNLFFPEFGSGYLVQYPFSKRRSVRTIRNVLRDGSLISLPDSGASSIQWQLEYEGLSEMDALSVKALFDACSGQLQPFSFIDPSDNALRWSSDLTNPVWQKSSLIKISSQANGPTDGTSSFALVNTSQTYAEMSQTVTVPANYQFCFSIYASSPDAGSLVLFRRGTQSETEDSALVNASWARLESQGRLDDGGSSFTVGLRLAPGQLVYIYGPQLDAQVRSSEYRPTGNTSGLYANCFWSNDHLSITAEAPNAYSAVIALETTI